MPWFAASADDRTKHTLAADDESSLLQISLARCFSPIHMLLLLLRLRQMRLQCNAKALQDSELEAYSLQREVLFRRQE